MVAEDASGFRPSVQYSKDVDARVKPGHDD